MKSSQKSKECAISQKRIIIIDMERKIGEIFEYNGEWYQCVVAIQGCRECSFRTHDYCTRHLECLSDTRSDKTSVIFKKLEKVGEMYKKRVSDGTFFTFQRYKVCNPVILPKKPYMYYNFIDSTIEMEIKQTEEDMEENKLNLKPFDLQKAREGKPVCTRDGRKARIICFDRDWDMRIVALVTDPLGESVHYYLSDGKVDSGKQNDEDLIMLPEKEEESMVVETFIKNDRKDNKVMMELLPWPELEEIAKVYTAGAKKYGPNRWQNLPDGYQRYKGAMLRHLTEHEKGNLIDSETGCYHIAQCAWNAIAMLHFILKEVERVEDEKENQSE